VEHLEPTLDNLTLKLMYTKEGQEAAYRIISNSE